MQPRACKLLVWKDRTNNHEWLSLGTAFPFIDLLLRFYCITGHKNMQPTRSFLVSAVSFLLAESNIKILFIKNDRGKLPLSNLLSCRFQHVFDKDPVPSGRIIDQNVGHGAHQLAVLNNWTAAHAWLSLWTTFLGYKTAMHFWCMVAM